MLEGINISVFYWDTNGNEKGEVKKCTVEKEFLYSRIEFYLAKSRQHYFVCVLDDGILFSVQDYNIIDAEGNIRFPNKIMSLFRNSFQKSNTTKEQIECLVKTPHKFKKMLNKTKKENNPKASKKRTK